MDESLQGFRASIAYLIDDPFNQPIAQSLQYWPDGLLVVSDAGQVVSVGDYQASIDSYPHLPLQDYSGYLILPGLIDTHIHFPQGEMIASYGEELLTWLDRYTFPTELKYQDADYAAIMADRFLDELLKQGTTTALVFAAVFPQSASALFTAAQRRRMCLITGKVMMDRHAPEGLLDTAESSYGESKQLIERWHGCDRLYYAVTPRFVITSSMAQLEAAGRLLQEFPTVYLQTHLSENVDEVALAKSLFPDCDNYLDIYDAANLVTNRSIFAHSIHLEEAEWQRLAGAGAAIAFCPTSNLFLGSGLFDLDRAKTFVEVGLGSDVGGGTSFSLLQTANEAYKVAQLQRQSLTPWQTLYLLTLGGARVLKLDHRLGNLQPGKDADFIVLDAQATSQMALRNGAAATPQTLAELSDRLFGFWMLGDDRAVRSTYILGQKML